MRVSRVLLQRCLRARAPNGVAPQIRRRPVTRHQLPAAARLLADEPEAVPPTEPRHVAGAVRPVAREASSNARAVFEPVAGEAWGRDSGAPSRRSTRSGHRYRGRTCRRRPCRSVRNDDAGEDESEASARRRETSSLRSRKIACSHWKVGSSTSTSWTPSKTSRWLGAPRRALDHRQAPGSARAKSRNAKIPEGAAFAARRATTASRASCPRKRGVRRSVLSGGAPSIPPRA